MTDRHAELGRVRAALAASGDLIYDWNLSDDTVLWVGPVTRVFGPDGHAGMETGEGLNRCINPRDLPLRLKALSDHLSRGQAFDCEYRVRAGAGRYCWVHDRGAAKFDEAGQPVRMIGTVRAIDERKRNEARLEYLANHDELTGLYNRSRLRDGLEHVLAYCTRYNSPGAYLVVGIDMLTMINETFGCETADAVIVQVARELEQSLRGSDMIGRVGGDQFGVVLSHGSEPVARAAADKLLCTIRQTPVVTPSGPIHVTVTIGVVAFPGIPDSVSDIMTKAETALQEAKCRGRNCFVSYCTSDAQRDERRKTLRIAEQVRIALKENRLLFAYQPIVEATSREVAYYECLLRMTDEDGEVVPAVDFVPAVEQMGLIKVVDRRVMEMAVDVLARHPGVKLDINVSGLTASDESWLRALHGLLWNKEEIASRLGIEITETAAVRDMEETARFVSTVRELGCRLALDDFGAGYTSFRQLKSLRVDMVKIDGSFVHNLSDNLDNQLFVHTLVKLAEGFGLETVAECVETTEEADLLTRQGVKYLQGYHFGRPDLAPAWLSDGTVGGAAGLEAMSDSPRRAVGHGTG
jgi:diguanylate cyclase (GGDEF)-like protein